MPRKSSLREFQAHLAARLAGVGDQRAAGFLGIQSGADYWLIALPDAGEIVSVPPLDNVPLTRPWFIGIANVRGNLYSVTDFSAFRGKEATPRNALSRLLLIGTRHGNNAALLVTRLLGLRNLDDLTLTTSDIGVPAWMGDAYVDKDGRRWQILNVRALFQDDNFMDIGV
jgi:twitching motility protein PilI